MLLSLQSCCYELSNMSHVDTYGPLRVLMIDDNPMDLEFVRNLLRQVPDTPISFASVETLESGLEQIATGNYDLVLLDLYLPDAAGVSGIFACRRIAPRLPILVVSASTDPKLERDTVSCGANGFINKGDMTVERFTETLQEVLGKAPAAGTSLANVGEKLPRQDSNLRPDG